MPADDVHLRVEGLGLRLGDFALRGIELACARGEYHILLGPTGSGKSSLMKCILGLHRVDEGRIVLGGRDVTREPPERRQLGYVPQNYALFPHLDVAANVRFGLGAARLTRAAADRRVDEMCALLGIEALRRRAVRGLSGGERQKVALARALAIRPQTILLDEPFSSIDEGGKRRLWFELRQAIAEVGVTALHITHNLDEACAMGQRLSVLMNGRLVHNGTSRELLERPHSVEVARFLGYRNLFPGRTRLCEAGTAVTLDGPDGLDIVLARPLPPDTAVTVCIRPQDIKIVKEDEPLGPPLAYNVFSGAFVELLPLTDVVVGWFRLADRDPPLDLEVRFPPHIAARHALEVGRPLRIALWEPAVTTFPS